MDHFAKRLVEVIFKHRLEATEDEVAATSSEDNKREVEWYEVFAKGIAFDASEGGYFPYDPVG